MTLYTDAEQGALQQATVRDIKTVEGISSIPYSRPQLWAAAQAVRDVLDGAALRTALSTAIDAALPPAPPMSNAAKKRFVARLAKRLFAGEE